MDDLNRDEIDALARLLRGEAATPLSSNGKGGSVPIDWPTFWMQDRTAPEWLIEPVLPRGRAVAIYSPAGQGKSELGLVLAAGAATGRRTLTRPANEPLTVVYFDFEMTEDDVYDRLDLMGYGPDDNLGHLYYYLLPDLPPLDTAEGGAEVRAIAAHHNADTVIIDTTGRVLSGAENDADTLRAYHAHTGQPLKADGRGILRLDHAGKDPTKGQRGTSAKNDDVDIVWRLTQREGGARLHADKRRMAWVPPFVDLVRLTDPIRYELATTTWPSGTMELATILDQLNIPLGHGRPVVRQALKEAGVSATNSVLAAAVRYRREQASNPRTGPRTGPDSPHGQVHGQEEGNVVFMRDGQVHGQVRTASADKTDSSVPLGTDSPSLATGEEDPTPFVCDFCDLPAERYTRTGRPACDTHRGEA
jgi:hypothetical protein